MTGARLVPLALTLTATLTATLGCGAPGGNRPVPQAGAGPQGRPVGGPPSTVPAAPEGLPASVEVAPPNPGANTTEAGGRRGAEGPRTLVATVAGTRIELHDLLGAWLRRDGSGVRTLLDDLVLSRIVELESARFGVELPAGQLERALEQRRRALDADAVRAGAPSLEAFLLARLGLTPEQFFGGLERELVIDLLAPRVVRAWLLVSERVEVRVISVREAAARDEILARLGAGEAFAQVASELSEDPSKEDGGRMPPVVRGESALSLLAFATPVGETAGPILEEGRYLFLRAEARPRPLTGSWSTLGREVEASLARRGIEDPEYWQWQEAMQDLYEVDLEPFRGLLGGAP